MAGLIKKENQGKKVKQSLFNAKPRTKKKNVFLEALRFIIFESVL